MHTPYYPFHGFGFLREATFTPHSSPQDDQSIVQTIGVQMIGIQTTGI